jgi:dihydroorotate dehydrogenase (NAD+) catalytic subunit
MVDLTSEIAGLKLKNPTILASGILGETGKTLSRVIEHGAGAITTKSIGLEPRAGHDNPTIVELDCGLLNAMGLPNPGIDEYKSELEHAVQLDAPVIGSIFGKNASEFAVLGKAMETYKVQALELNLSCPHAEGYGSELGSVPERVKEVTGAVRDAVSIPVFVKLTPNTSDIVSLGKAAVAGGCSGLVAINTVKGLAINAELGMPVLSNKFGGYSGPAIKPIGLRCVYELAAADLGVPIIGVGGINSGIDIAEYLMAGASVVQIGTAVYYDGITAFEKLVTELRKFMEENNHNSINDLIGLAHKN